MCMKELGLTDDMAVGAVIELLLGYKLTDVLEMQNHVEKQKYTVKPEQLKNMVYSLTSANP